jgi:hypothetical protein
LLKVVERADAAGTAVFKAEQTWLSDDCIDAMNQAFVDFISKIRPDARERLREWAASTVEIGYCLEHPEVMELRRRWSALRAVH